MNKLILGGIYLSPNDNYLVVVNIDAESDDDADYYNIALFSKNIFTQNDLQIKSHIPMEEYDPCFIEIDAENLNDYFNSGYCGRINKEFLKELDNVFQVGNYYFHYADFLERVDERN